MTPERHELQEAADDLNLRWEQLDTRRFTGQAVGGHGVDGSPRLHLAEYQALSRLEEAALDRAKRPSLVRNALAQLDAAYELAITVDLEATRRVAGRRLAEYLRAYRALPSGTVPLSSLNSAARAAWNAYQEPLAGEVAEGLLLRCSLGEFFKEAYTSKTMRDVLDLADFDAIGAEDGDEVYLNTARDVLEPAEHLLNSGELLGRHNQTLAATAIRHLAVVHEYLYHRTGQPQKLRAAHLDRWLRLSVDAAAICADQEEFSTQAYALVNKAAALAELAAPDGAEPQLRTLLDSAGDVQKAQDLFALTGDDRGVAWSGIHLARIYARQYELSQKTATTEEIEGILRSMLETAIDAESNSRRIDDEIAQGLASLYLCAAEKEAQRLNLNDLSISDEPEIAQRARQAAKVLSLTHRLPQAARALQIAAQCELVIADRSAENIAQAASRVRAMNDLTAAIAILDDSGDLDRNSSERIIVNLHNSVAESVPRWRF